MRAAPPDLLRRLRDMPEVELPRISHIVTDDRDRVWAKQYDPTEDAHWIGGWAGPEGGVWWVTDAQMRHLRRAEIPGGVYPLAIAEDRLLGRHTDAVGVQRVVVYRISN